MSRFLKKYFIPHANNGYHPHILRSDAVSIIITTVIVFEALLLVPYDKFAFVKNYLATIISPVLVDYANDARKADNLEQLKINPLLEKAAQMKAEDMVANGYFAHTSPSGVEPWHWLRESGYKYSYAGENLAVNFIDSSDVHSAWMNSPTHRANIMGDKYTEIGVATVVGKFKERDAIFVVQFFGRPQLLTASTFAKKVTVNTPPPPRPQLTTPIPSPRIVLEPTKDSQTMNFVAGEETSEYSDIAEKIASSPRRTVSSALAVLLLSVLMSIVATALIKHEIHQHPYLVNAMLLFVALAGALYTNEHFIALAGSVR